MYYYCVWYVFLRNGRYTTAFTTNFNETDVILKGPLHYHFLIAGVVEDTKVEPPQGYTIRGEACRDKCDYYGYTYTWCHKVTPSNLGNWRGSDYCSNEPSMYICSWFSILFWIFVVSIKFV